MIHLKGKTAAVVAGGNGIGRAIALALAAEGVNIVVADIRAADAQHVSDEINAKGGCALAIGTDVTKLADMQHLADAAFNRFGTVEILCNNAGVTVRPFRAIWDTSYADLQYMINTNIWGLLHGYYAFVPRMRLQKGEKHIVNTSSMASILTIPSLAIYTLSKGALDGFSRVTAEELRADGFGVTILYPGLVNTSAAQRSGELRSREEQRADAAVRPYASYAQDRGESLTQLSAGRGPLAPITGGASSQEAIEAEAVGLMVVNAIKQNRPVCMTHPVPTEAIQKRVAAWMDGYKPLE